MEDAQRFYWSLPPLTRIWGTASLGLTGAATLEMIDPAMLVFDWNAIRYHTELWRLVTCFCYGGGHMRHFHVMILLYLIVTMSARYERQPLNTGTGGSHADAAFAMLFCAVTIVATVPLLNWYGPQLLLWWFNNTHKVRFHMEAVYTRTLIYAILYLWSRRHPNANADINFVPMKAKFLPFAHVGFGYCMNHRIHEMVHGIVVGHLFYYVTTVLPTITQGRMGVTTPQFLVEWCGEPVDRVERAAGVYERQQNHNDAIAAAEQMADRIQQQRRRGGDNPQEEHPHHD